MHAPAYVTLTGLDAHTDLARAEALSARYPVEWGLLFSPGRQGAGRYPPPDAVEAIIARPLRLAAHLCGGHAKAVAGTGDCPDLRPVLAGRVSRVQVNIASGAGTGRIAAFAASLGDGVRGILQCRDPGAFPTDPTVDWLYDRSAGNGILPEAWPAPAGPDPVGYAGGLGPDTVAGALSAIARRHPAGVPFWIDMETRVRDADDRLDLDLCESVLRTVYPSL